jgi:hypothetical protein
MLVIIPNSPHFGKLIPAIPKRTLTMSSSRKTKTLEVSVLQDDITAEISKAFDYEFAGTTTFNCPTFDRPLDYQIGLIVGSS